MILLPRIKHFLREVAWCSDLIYRPIGRLRGRQAYGPDDVDFFCSGFPRSGNHFCSLGIQLLSTTPLRVNLPSHIPPLVERSVKQEKPTVIVVREPRDAVLSWAIYTRESVDHALRYYLQYHRLIQPYLAGVEVAKFEEFTRDLRPLMTRLSTRWGMSFSQLCYDHESIKAQIYHQIESIERRNRGGKLDPTQLPAPSEKRHFAKEQLAESLLLSENQKLLKACEACHARLLASRLS